jgi:serine protease
MGKAPGPGAAIMGRSMRTRLWLMVPLLLVGGLVAWGWSGATRSHRVADVPPEELAEEAGVSPRSLIVDFRDETTDQALASNGYDEEPISRFSSSDRLYRLRFATADEAVRAASALRQDPTVESVDYDVEASIPPGEAWTAADPGTFAECAPAQPGAATKGFPDDPCFRYQWHLRQVSLPAAWALGQGRGVTVAVIDTGVSRVPDLRDTKIVAGYNFVADNERAEDDHGHGTHVAGTIAQATNNRLGVSGVAFGATILPLKVLSAEGRGSMAAIAQAIRYAADHGARVINMSLGGPFPVTTIRHAIDYARNKGVVVVAAAGNDGRGRVSYPARYPGVLAVASTQFDEHTTFYSNWGKEIDLAAPGGNTKVDQNGDGKPDGVLQNTVVPGDISRTDYLWFMGTSMASPHVAGVAALVIGAGVTRPDAVEAVLLETARRPKPAGAGASGRIDDHYGAGIVDANAALKKARVGRDAGSLGLGASLALMALGGLRRRRRPSSGVGLGFVLALAAGAIGVPEGFAAWAGPASFGNPVLLSAMLPVVAIGLLYGISRLRPALAGLGYGVAGALLFGALSYVADVRFVPDVLDRAWLLGNAALATVVASFTLRRPT